MEKQLRILVIPLLAFLVCFSIVAVCNRFASDDFEFLNKLRDFGWLGSVKWFHEHWNTRWSAIAVLNGVLLLSLKTGTLWWYHLLCLLLLWYAVLRVINNLNGDQRKQNMILAGYISIAFFYSCFSIPDVFFWINTSTMYLLGTIALLFAIGEITQPGNSTGSYLRLAAISIFMAGAYEPLVLTCMVTSIIILSMLIRKNRWRVWYIPFDKKIIIFLSGLMLGFAISFLGEGHVVRSSFLPQTTFSFKAWVWVKAMIKMFGIYLPVKILPALIFSFPWFVIALSREIPWLTSRMMKVITVVFVLLVMISLLPVSFIMSEMGPERAWTQVSIYTVVFSVFIAMYGGKIMKNKFSNLIALRVYVIISLFYITATGLPAIVQAYYYSSAFDERIAQIHIQKKSGRIELLFLDPLPKAGWLHSAELDTSESHFNNRFMKEYLELSFSLKRY